MRAINACAWLARWCGARQISPFQASVGFVINFLTEMFKSGFAYDTLNGYRSAISASQWPAGHESWSASPKFVLY